MSAKVLNYKQLCFCSDWTQYVGVSVLHWDYLHRVHHTGISTLLPSLLSLLPSLLMLLNIQECFFPLLMSDNTLSENTVRYMVTNNDPKLIKIIKKE